MALHLASASSQYASGASASVTAVPLTIACWYKPTDTAARSLLRVRDASTQNRFELYSSTAAVAFITNGVGENAIAAAGSVSTGVWQHGAAVFPSLSSRTAYYNGVAGSAETTVIGVAPGSIAVTDVGFVVGAIGYFDGDVAEMAIWNVALSTDEIAALAKGFSPQLIRPASLMDYYPCGQGDRTGTTLINRWKGMPLTEVNTPTVADHPRVYYPET